MVKARSELADAIKKIRDENGWSMETLARRLGVSLQTVYRWEKGTKPSPLAKEKLGELGIRA